jgi:hypothetical protein
MARSHLLNPVGWVGGQASGGVPPLSGAAVRYVLGNGIPIITTILENYQAFILDRSGAMVLQSCASSLRLDDVVQRS